MKKTVTIFLALFVISLLGLPGAINAQSPVDFGIKGGLNFATFHGSDSDYETLSDYTVGIAVDISLPALPIDIESGVYYSHKGAQADGGSVRLNVEYIELPVLAKYNLGLSDLLNPHIVLGPYAGYAINSNARGITFSNVDSLEDFTNEFDFGLMGGLGADLNVAVTTVNIQTRYSYGITSVFDDGFDADANNGVFSIVAGIMF